MGEEEDIRRPPQALALRPLDTGTARHWQVSLEKQTPSDHPGATLHSSYETALYLQHDASHALRVQTTAAMPL